MNVRATPEFHNAASLDMISVSKGRKWGGFIHTSWHCGKQFACVIKGRKSSSEN
jgi:hypothetical protein